MDTRENALVEQDAPLKNTDKAFVQVGKDGAPHLPENDRKEDEKEMKPERTTDMDKR